MAEPLRTSPARPPGLRYVTVVMAQALVSISFHVCKRRQPAHNAAGEGMVSVVFFTVEVRRDARRETPRGGDGQGAAEVDEGGEGAAVDGLEAVLRVG